MVPASVCATWSNVLWSSLRTITRQLPPRPVPGPPVRGSSMVWLTARTIARSRPCGLPFGLLAPVALEPRPLLRRGHRAGHRALVLRARGRGGAGPQRRREPVRVGDLRELAPRGDRTAQLVDVLVHVVP